MPGSEHTSGAAAPVLSLDPAMVRQARDVVTATGTVVVPAPPG